MNISDILCDLDIKHVCDGNAEFESLGLLKSDTDKKICSFVVNEKYIKEMGSNISVLLTTDEVAKKIEKGTNDIGVCVVDNPRYVFFKLHNYLCGREEYVQKKYDTAIGENCKISEFAYIAPQNVRIGNNVTIEEFVSIKENVSIGDNCIIRAGSVIGGEGFEQKRHGKEVLSVHHAGSVIIGDNVELQQGNFVDKAIYPWDYTLIDDYTRTDNNVYIAHADKIHKRVLIAACTCIAGRVEIEDDVWIGPGVTLINGMHIGKEARVNIGAVATRDVPEGEAVTGNFAIPHDKFIENIKKLVK